MFLFEMVVATVVLSMAGTAGIQMRFLGFVRPSTSVVLGAALLTLGTVDSVRVGYWNGTHLLAFVAGFGLVYWKWVEFHCASYVTVDRTVREQQPPNR
jgi:hypothetical protein